VFSYSRKLTSLPYYGAAAQTKTRPHPPKQALLSALSLKKALLFLGLYGGSFQPPPPPAEEGAALARPLLRVDSAPAEVGALQSLKFRLPRSLEKQRPLMQALQSPKFRLIRPYQGP
jgi:hypothetical protein